LQRISLKALTLTVRDAVLGLSHQRIAQLLKAASGKGTRSRGRGIRVAGARPIPGRSQRLITLEPVSTTCVLQYFM
jgi:hypothetical protein